jgi:hypothetical protein
MNSLQRSVQLPTKEIILLIFFQKFPTMQLREALHHLTKARQGAIRLSFDRAGHTFCVTDFQHTRCLPKEK